MPKILRCLLPSLFLGLFAAAPAFSAERYVLATGGTNAGACTTIGSPCNTVAFALIASSAGDRINICATDCDGSDSGTHTEGLNLVYGSVPVGTSWANAITIRGYPGESITWTSSSGDSVLGFSTDSWPTQRNFYYIIQDLILDAVDARTVVFGGLGANYVRFENVEAKNAAVDGIGLTNGDFWELLNVSVHDNGGCAGHHGIYVGHGTSDLLIDGGSYYNNYGYGIHIYNGSGVMLDRITVRNTRIYHNNFGTGGQNCFDANGVPWADGIAGGIRIGPGDANKIYNNLIYDNLAWGMDVGNGSTNTLFANNTLYDNQWSIQIQGTNTTVRNNICYAHDTNDISNLGSGTTLSNNRCDGTNPLWTDAPNAVFTLLVGSPAIDAGADLSAVFTVDLNGTTRPQGSAWDQGAYERSAAVGGPGSGNTRSNVVTENCTGVAAALSTGYTQIYTTVTVNRDGSGRCTGSAATDVTPVTVRSTGTFANPQYAAGTVRSLGSSTTGTSYPSVGCLLSGDLNSARDGYGFLAYNFAGTIYTTLVRYVNNFGGELSQRTDVTWADGDVMAIECDPVTGHIWGFKNSAVVLDVLDSTHTTGKPGFGANGDALIDDIDMGNLNTTCQINITSPQAAQVLRRPGDTDVAWLTSGCSGNVDLEYSYDTGVTYLPMATVAHDSAPYTFDLDAQILGSSSDFRIRVKQGAVVDTETGIVLKGRYLK